MAALDKEIMKNKIETLRRFQLFHLRPEIDSTEEALCDIIDLVLYLWKSHKET